MGARSFPEVKRPGNGFEQRPRLLIDSRVIPLHPLWVFVTCPFTHLLNFPLPLPMEKRLGWQAGLTCVLQKRKVSFFTEYRTPDRPSRSLVTVGRANPAIIRCAEENLFSISFPTFSSHRISFATE